MKKEFTVDPSTQQLIDSLKEQIKHLTQELSELKKNGEKHKDNYKNSHIIQKVEINNKILFIMGNGPSLGKVMNNPEYLKILKNNHTFGLNAAYRAYEKYNFYPTYFGCFDYIVNESHKESFENLVLENNTIKEFYFIGNGKEKQSLFKEEVRNNTRFQKFNFIHVAIDKYTGISKSFDKYYNSGSSGANALQIGIMKGYKKIVLLGCDCNYVEEIDGVKHYDKKAECRLELTKNLDNNPNYWFSDYQKKGDRFNLPGTSKFQMGSWKNMSKFCPNDVEIINGSMISKIPYFNKQSMYNIHKTYILHYNYWNDKSKYTGKEAMGLIKNQFDNDENDEFQIYGNRLFQRMFDLYNVHSKKALISSKVLEIGCGMGRYSIPFCKNCEFYYGIDINARMIKENEEYIGNKVTNYKLILNDGINIKVDEKLDLIFSTGVFQHIVLIDVIINYIKQGLKLLNDSGIFFFQFMGFYTKLQGSGTNGAKITAKILNKYLKNDKSINYKINEINIDKHDPMKQIWIVLQKTTLFNESERDFEKIKMIDRNFRTGVFDDLSKYNSVKKLWLRNAKQEIHKLTFYD